MNDFKNSLKVERDKNGRILLNKQLEELFIDFMKGKISKKDLMELTGILDKNTVEIKIEELIIQKPQLKGIYEEYLSKKRKSFKDYEFLGEAIEMLKGDYSQSDMAKNIKVNRRTFSTKMKKLEEKNQDNILGSLLKEHSERNIKEARKKESLEEKNNRRIWVTKQLDIFIEENKLKIETLSGNSLNSIRLNNMEKTLEVVDSLIQKGKTIKQLDEEGIISESMYRKYRAEVENLKRIFNDDKGNKNNINSEER